MLDIDKDWYRDELQDLDPRDLDDLHDEVDRVRISLQSQLDLAKARFKQKGVKSDPDWMARTKSKLAHMRRKRQMIQEVRAQNRERDRVHEPQIEYQPLRVIPNAPPPKR